MKILIVSATENEILPTINQLESTKFINLTIDTLITGVGSVFTTYSLIRKLNVKEYDYVINAGIAGSFNKDLKIGDVVQVYSDEFADLGIEDKDELYTIFEKGFMNKDEFPFKDGILFNPYETSLNFKKVSAITVNTTHGSEKSVNLFRHKFNADIETMEGAAFFYVCLQEGVRFMQLRAISNYVEERDIASWNIPLAIKNLNAKLLECIDVIVKK